MAELQFPLQFKRQYSGPLDADLVFDTIVNKNNYLSNSLRYAGQICSCVQENGKIFILNTTLDQWIELNTTLIGQNGIQVNNTNNNTWTIEVTGQFGDNNLRTEIANITANFENRITDLENNPIPDIFRSEVQAISSNLQTQIDNITGTSSVAALNDLTDVTITNPISGQVLKFNGIEWINAINNIETSYLHLAGIIDCNTTDKIYTINHIYVENTTPIVSIIAPMSGSELFIENIYNVQPTLFNVVLSSIPSTSGYQISWTRNKLNNNVITTNSFLSLIDTPSSYTGNAGKFIAVSSTETGLEFKTVNISSNQHNDLTGIQGGSLGEYFHLTSSQYSDYIGKTEVYNISGNLQNQINNISEETTTIIPGYGVSVIESPIQTWTIAVTGQFGDNTLRSEVENISSNLQTQLNNISGNFAIISYVNTISSNLQTNIDNIDISLTTEIQNISGNLQNQINNISEESTVIIPGYGISIIESPIQTWLISVTGQFGDNNLRTELENITANFENRITDLENNPIPDIFRTEVQNISSNLQTQIDNISGSSTVASLNDLTDVTINNPISGQSLYFNGIEWINYTPSNSNTYLNLAGIIDCDTTNQSYTINHIYVENMIPIVSIVAPTSSSNLFIQNLYDISNTNFKVILSDIPSISGYKITWTLQKQNELLSTSNSFLGLIDTPKTYTGQNRKIIAVSSNETSLEFITINHNTTSNLQGGISGEYFHLTSSQYSDYIGKTEIQNISGNLQSQIDNISGNNLLNDLNDVILSNPTSGNILLYNGNNWINKPLVKTITTIYQGTPISNNKLSFTNVPYNLNINKYRITTDGTNYSSTLNLVKSTTIPTSSDIITTITLTNTNNITGSLNIDVNENDFIGFITQNTSANFLNIQMFGTLNP